MQLTGYDGQAGLVLKGVEINGKQAQCVHARANLHAQNIPSSKVISYGLRLLECHVAWGIHQTLSSLLQFIGQFIFTLVANWFLSMHLTACS